MPFIFTFVLSQLSGFAFLFVGEVCSLSQFVVWCLYFVMWKQYCRKVPLSRSKKAERRGGSETRCSAWVQNNRERLWEAIYNIWLAVCSIASKFLLPCSSKMTFFYPPPDFPPLWITASHAGGAWGGLHITRFSFWGKIKNSVHLWCFTFSWEHRIW